MGTLGRYLSKEFIKLIILFLIVFLSIYLIIDFVQKIDNFIEADVHWIEMLKFFINKIPFILIQMIPVAVLLAVIVLFSILKKNREITAMKASGLSILEISKPVLFVSLFIAIVTFLFSELIVPYASSKSNEIWNVQVNKKDKDWFYKHNHIWHKGENSIYWIKKYDPKNKRINELSLYFFNDDFQLQERIDARRAEWTGERWKLKNGLVHKKNNEGEFDLGRFDEKYLSIKESPKDFERDTKKPEEMSYWELKRFTQKVRQEGYDVTDYIVGMHIKLAFPLISSVMVLIGIPIALGIRKESTPLAIAIGIAICFIYIAIFGFSRSLGLFGALPPVIAAWLANIVFFLIGAYLMIRVET